MRGRRAAAAMVAALAAVTAGCSPPATTPGGPGTPAAQADGQLTVAHARQVFSTFVTTADVAGAAGDEPLALSLAAQAQLPLTVAAYENADFNGAPTARYRYGAGQFYVPQLKTFPLWFAVAAPRTPLAGGPTRTAIMVFGRDTSADPWQLTFSALLQPGAALPPIAVDPSGHAGALATFDRGLLVSPNSVGALQSAVVDDGATSAAAAAAAAGPFTTGLHEQLLSARHQTIRLGLHYESEYGGTAFPLYALRTTDGGALVLYSLYRTTIISRPAKRLGQIQVPSAVAPLLYAAGHLVLRTELDEGDTLQYATYVPPAAATKSHPRMRVVAFDGGPTTADGR